MEHSGQTISLCPKSGPPKDISRKILDESVEQNLYHQIRKVLFHTGEKNCQIQSNIHWENTKHGGQTKNMPEAWVADHPKN